MSSTAFARPSKLARAQRLVEPARDAHHRRRGGGGLIAHTAADPFHALGAERLVVRDESAVFRVHGGLHLRVPDRSRPALHLAHQPRAVARPAVPRVHGEVHAVRAPRVPSRRREADDFNFFLAFQIIPFPRGRFGVVFPHRGSRLVRIS